LAYLEIENKKLLAALKRIEIMLLLILFHTSFVLPFIVVVVSYSITLVLQAFYNL
jgi:hypothetical protein